VACGVNRTGGIDKALFAGICALGAIEEGTDPEVGAGLCPASGLQHRALARSAACPLAKHDVEAARDDDCGACGSIEIDRFREDEITKDTIDRDPIKFFIGIFIGLLSIGSMILGYN